MHSYDEDDYWSRHEEEELRKQQRRLMEEQEEEERKRQEEEDFLRMLDEERKRQEEEEEYQRQKKEECQWQQEKEKRSHSQQEFGRNHYRASYYTSVRNTTQKKTPQTIQHRKTQKNKYYAYFITCLMLICAVELIFILTTPKAEKPSKPHNEILDSVPNAIVNHDTIKSMVLSDTASLITKSPLPSDSKILEKEYTELRKHRDYDKGYNAGYEDGREDAESGEYRSYGNMSSNPSKAYVLGYEEGYDEGYDDSFERREFPDYDDATLDDMGDE